VYCLLRPSRKLPVAREELPARTSSMADSDAENDDEVHNDSDNDQLSISHLSVNRSLRTYARCVWCSSATHDLLSCRAARAPVSVLHVSLSLSNKLAVAQYATLTSAWSCVCTSGSDMLQKLTIYCLRTIRTVFLSLRFAFLFDFFK